MLSDKIRTLKLTEPLFVPSGTSVRQVIEAIQERRTGAVLVSDGARLKGILTERDVLMKVVTRDVSYDDPVDKFMTPDPRTLSPERTIGEAITLMMHEGFRNVPILDDKRGEPVGLLRVRDIIFHLAESFPAHVLNLPPRPHQAMKTPEGA